ncbi:MAG: hypothetical protein IKZ16_07820 [Clostridia bacterium]|nr:hypothetical protein [Clostridia bacterium]
MKRALCIFASTVLCLTVLSSCDFSGGLVGELFGDVKDIAIGEQIYPTDDYIELETDIAIDTDPPTEIKTDDETQCDTTHSADTTQPVDTTFAPSYTRPVTDIPPDSTDSVEILLPVNGITLDDWQELSCAYYQGVFDQSSLIADVGELTDRDGFVMYTAVDTSYLYFGFEVHDETVLKSDNNSFSGDHFTISLDLGGFCQEQEELTPVLYSFGPHPRGVIYVGAQFEGEDADQAQFVSSETTPRYDLLGGTRASNNLNVEFHGNVGWRTEFAIHWAVLLDHLEKNHGEAIMAQNLNFDDMLIVVNVTYVDVDQDGNVIKSYSIAYPLQLSISVYDTSVSLEN